MIAHLPSHLLALIFADVIPRLHHHNPLMLSHSIQTSRTALSLVCTRWNRITSETPGLWSTIVLYASNSPTYYQRIARSLDRSKPSLLDVCIIAGSDSSDFVRMVDTLKRHGDRWRSIQIHNVQGRSALQNLLPKSLPCLEKAVFHNVLLEPTDFQASVALAPRLQSLTAMAHGGGGNFYGAFGDCHILREYILSEPTTVKEWEELLSYLAVAATSAIVRLEIRGTIIQSPIINDATKGEEPVELLYLKEIDVVRCSVKGIAWLFNHVVTPSLRITHLPSIPSGNPDKITDPSHLCGLSRSYRHAPFTLSAGYPRSGRSYTSRPRSD